MLMRRVLLAALLIGVGAAHAQQAPSINVPTDDSIVEVMMTAMESMSGDIATLAAQWLSAFMLLQFVMTNYKLLLDLAELEQIFAKLAGSIVWFGVVWYLLDTAPAWINDVGMWFLGRYSQYFPSVSGIVASTTAIAAGLTAIAAAVGAVSNTIGFLLIFLVITVVLAGIFLAGKIVMLKVELMLNVLTAPFSFAFLGLNALRDQAIAPFKALISLMYRVVIYAVVSAGYLGVHKAQIDLIDKYGGFDALAPLSSSAMMLKYMFAATIAQALLMYLLFKSDAIAASLANGTTSLNSADMTAAVAAAAAASSATSGMARHTQAGAKGIMEMMAGQRGGVQARNVSDLGAGLAGGAVKPEMGGVASLGDGGGGVNDGASEAAARELGPNPNEFRGQSNPLPPEKHRDPARDAAREQRRQARASGSGQGAAIAAGNAPQGPSSGGSGRLDRLQQHMERDKVQTHVTINTNAN